MEIKDCEIFDLLDFCDVNAKKPYWVDDFGEEDKFNIVLFFFWGGGGSTTVFNFLFAC